jgi:enoyl-CoA hydratase/carnithine racemase
MITGGGNSHAMELVLTGHIWSAQEAAVWGMARRVVREGDGEEDGTNVVKEAVALAGLRGVAVVVPCGAAATVIVVTSSCPRGHVIATHRHHRATIVAAVVAPW